MLIELLVKKGNGQHRSLSVFVDDPDVTVAHVLRELLPTVTRRPTWQIFNVFHWGGGGGGGSGEFSEPLLHPIVG